MLFNGFILLASVVLSFVMTYFVRIWSIKRAILDIPNDRSSHTIPTPRGGGLAVAIVWFLVISLLFLNSKIDNKLYFALLCGIPISAIGLLDDVITISPKIRLIIQIVSSILAIMILGGLKIVEFGSINFQSTFILSVIAVIGIVWFTNLFNFLDGIDGYISTEVIFICTAFFLLTKVELPLFLAAASLGFLLLNWQPAKIFMGDVGSTLLGFTIGVLAVYYQNTGEASIAVWLLLTSLFWFDATITLYRRWRNKESLSKAHRKHAYQRIVQSGFSHQKTVLLSLGFNLIIFGLAWLMINNSDYTLYIFGINLVFLWLIMKLVDKRFPFPK